MKVVIIGGTGHIGSYLVRMLAEQGHDLIAVSSGRTQSHVRTDSNRVRFITMRYTEMTSSGEFAAMLREERAGAVVDILQGDTQGVYDACKSTGVGQLVLCGSVWMFGRAKVVPTPETTQTECQFEGYRRRYAQMQEALARSRTDGFAVTAIMPPNICGPGKVPLDGAGGRSVEVHKAHKRGKRVVLPYPGTNLIGPCDAEDVARGFACAIADPGASEGEMFNVGSAYALTATQFIRTYSAIYRSPIPIEYVPAETFISDVCPDVGMHFHFVEHMCPDISKISSRLGYRPSYTPEESMDRAVKWMHDQGLLS